MKIASFETYTVAIPTRRVHTWASSTVDVGKGYLLLKLVTDDGVVGWGESTGMAEWGGDYGKYNGETAATTKVVLQNNLFPAIEGMDPFDLDLLHRRMDLAIRGFNYAKAAVDQAVYDILGKALDKPVYQLLGGKHRSRIPIAHSLGIMDTDAAVAEAVEAVKEGIRTIKVKVGLDHKRDVTLIRKLREALGPDIAMLADANQGYPTAKDAVKWVGEMIPYDLEYIEQPVEGLVPMQQVTRMLPIPVCADESCWTIADAVELLRHNAADYFSIYTTKPGGLYPARSIAKIAENAGVRCNVNGSGEFGVGNAANLHLAASGRNIDLASVFPVTHVEGREQTKIAGHWYRDDIVKKPFVYEEGCLVVPDGPGLGIEVDMEKVRKYSVG